jgi:Flp pilus assembly pilin Flp
MTAGLRAGLARIGRRATLRLRRFHHDETGDEGVNKILIIAMIAIPLIIALIAFGDKIVEFFKDAWDKLTGKEIDEPSF